jgi:hypothetical protein
VQAADGGHQPLGFRRRLFRCVQDIARDLLLEECLDLLELAVEPAWATGPSMSWSCF